MRELKIVVIISAATIALVLAADRVHEIGERIPYVILSLWFGSATIAALIFSSACTRDRSGSAPPAGSRIWAGKMRRMSWSLLPLTAVPLLEIRHSGYDPALWLIDGILIVSICSVPYFFLLARSIVGAARARMARRDRMLGIVVR